MPQMSPMSWIFLPLIMMLIMKMFSQKKHMQSKLGIKKTPYSTYSKIKW